MRSAHGCADSFTRTTSWTVPSRSCRAGPLIAMGFRLRRSARLGPLRFNFSSGGLNNAENQHPHR